MKTDEPMVAFSKATEESIGDQPMIPDPYESRTVEVKRMSSSFTLCAASNLNDRKMRPFYSVIQNI